MRQLSLNERQIVQLVATHGAVARIDLARQTGLTGASVTRIIGALDEIGLLDEVVDKSGGQGQPKRLLSIRPNSYFTAGFTFTLRSIEVALIDAATNLVAAERVIFDGGPSYQTGEKARHLIANLMSRNDIPETKLLGVGCAIPGNFGSGGKLIKAHEVFQDFDDPGMLDRFVAAFNFPFHLENDGTAAALGEYIFARQPGDGPSLYLIHLAHGVGGGLVSNNRPFRGVNGNAGLPGFLYPYGEPRPSALDLLETLEAAGHPLLDFPDIDDRYLEDPVLQNWCRRAADQLVKAVTAGAGFLDPSVIVIGGRLETSILKRIVQAITMLDIPGPSRGLNNPPLRASTLGSSGSAIGAACLPLFDRLFAGAREDRGNAYLNGKAL